MRTSLISDHHNSIISESTVIRASCYSDRQNFAFSGGAWSFTAHLTLFSARYFEFYMSRIWFWFCSAPSFQFLLGVPSGTQNFFLSFFPLHISFYLLFIAQWVFRWLRDAVFLCVHLSLCDCEMRSLCQTSSLEFTVTQWLEHPTSVRKVVGSIPIWNSEIVSEFFSPHISFNLSGI